MPRPQRLSSILGLTLMIGTASGCDTRKAEGGSCAESKECADGLACVAALCADATKSTRMRTKNLQRTGQQFMNDNKGTCPQVTDLGKADETTDVWGTPFRVLCPSEHAAIDVVSNGPDKQPDSADDVASWQP
jgi:hypothetical protein